MVVSLMLVLMAVQVTLAQAVKIIEGGKLVIPAAMRRAMGIARSDTVVVELLSDGELRVRPLASAIREAQEIVRKSVRPDRSLADELMRERKRDAVR
jgi:AbrB family looped-hinge helix DNA binding protein